MDGDGALDSSSIADSNSDSDTPRGVELFSIKGVEIFASGTWNGENYSDKDLDEMVQAFKDNHQTYKPYLKLGHDDGQKLLQADGYPAAGYIGSLKRVGKKLIADFIDIPKKVFELIKNKAYKKVSAEIFWNAKINGKEYKRSLAAVSLLGADVPAVSCLNDILAFYGLTDYNSIKSYSTHEAELVKKYEFDNNKGDVMSGQTIIESDELKTFKDKLTESESQLNAVKEEKAKIDAELAELKKFKADAEAKLVEAAKKEKENQLESFINELEGKSLCTAGMKPLVKAFFSEDAEVKTYSINDKEYKTKNEIFAEILAQNSAASKVNFSDNTKAGQVEKEELTVEKIEKFAKEHDMDFSKAYLQLKKEQ